MERVPRWVEQNLISRPLSDSTLHSALQRLPEKAVEKKEGGGRRHEEGWRERGRGERRLMEIKIHKKVRLGPKITAVAP